MFLNNRGESRVSGDDKSRIRTALVRVVHVHCPETSPMSGSHQTSVHSSAQQRIRAISGMSVLSCAFSADQDLGGP